MPAAPRDLRLPQVEREASPKRIGLELAIGCLHVDIAQVRTALGRLYLIVAIDGTHFTDPAGET
jgi:hypothetical protein